MCQIGLDDIRGSGIECDASANIKCELNTIWRDLKLCNYDYVKCIFKHIAFVQID